MSAPPSGVRTPGRAFYERQVRLLMDGDARALVEANYHPDAVAVTWAGIARGHAELIPHFAGFLDRVQILELVSTDRWSEGPDTIFFEATVRTNFGLGHVYDAFVLREGRATHHFTGEK